MEPTLVILFPDGAVQAVPLSGGNGRTEVTLGRAAGNTVEIDHPAISRRHLRLVRVPGGAWQAEDSRSANGTLYNGDPLGSDAVALLDGDCLAFGPDPAAVRAVYVQADTRPPVPGGPPEMSELLPPGMTLAGRYWLEESLGRTPEYQAYRATDAATGQVPVSLKVFLPEALAPDGFPALVGRVDRLRAIPSHPGVIRCLDVRREEEHVFVVSRWVDNGFPMLDLLRTRGALTLPEALRLLAAAASASDHVAGHGEVSLDLGLRPTLLSFHAPLADPAADWERLRPEALDRWPAFAPRFVVALVTPPAEAAERLAALARFACELLGRPLPDGGRARPPRIVHPALGEAGNEVLYRVLSAVVISATRPASDLRSPAYTTGREFVTALAHAAGLELTPLAGEG